MCSSDDLEIGFLAFMSSFYVLDVEYPRDIFLALTLVHQVVFLDNRIEKSIAEEYKVLWGHLKVYFNDVDLNFDRI